MCYNVCDFGAVGDGKTNDSAAIQKAIEECSEAGGGRVLVPAGRIYLTGTFLLKSNVEFCIERGATVAASGNWDDYTTSQTKRQYRTLIASEHASDISITGGGVIDGGGRLFVETVTPYIYRMRRRRPFTMFLIGCNNVTIRDVVFRDGALWTVRLSGCEDVVIHGVRILNDLKLPNNDAIDLDRCRNVRISDCNIESGDDCIVLKTCKETAEYGPCENITVTGCTLMSTSAALIIGCEARSVMRNVVFDSCVISSSHRGLAIHLSEESDVENVIFSNMIVETRLFHEDWWGRAEPIYITAIPWTSQHKIGHVRHVRFSNILCRSENGVFIQGWEKNLVDDILLENVRVEVDKWSKWPGGRQDIRPCPGEGLLEHPTSGFYIKNAQNVTLRNCEVVWGDHRPDYFHHALECHNVDNLKLENFEGNAAHPGKYQAIYRD
ncbi:MAG: glycosyl hydrolase family 28 protein [Candidatus Bathyarchaeota archaeon]|nr:glycosyl hydrolase family 28 protein [Candidatus Bathyarchaeota archaeon]MDH5688849.1 glycosyl hydrolase family 28 protein [Candidatus Bathyarchaeota archaeon]